LRPRFAFAFITPQISQWIFFAKKLDKEGKYFIPDNKLRR